MINILKSRFSYLSISQKLTVIVSLALFTTVLIAASFIIIYDRNQSKLNLETESKVLSNILGVRSAAALLFLDKNSAQTNLSTLSQRSETLYACIYNSDNVLFSKFEKGSDDRCFENISAFKNNNGIFEFDKQQQIITIEPISLKGRDIGYILISSGLDKLNARTIDITLVTLGIMVVASFFSFLITRKLQHTITNPILELSDIAKEITVNQNYGLRAKAIFNDETAILTKAFNQMLHHIQGVQLEMGELIEELKENSQRSKDEADEMAERNESIRHYFSGVTHDLKQPLQAIEMFSSILVTSPEDHRDVVNSKLRASVANLRQMFDDWLNVSRLEDSLKQSNKLQVKIQPMLEAIVSEVSVLANDKNLKLKVFCPDYTLYTNAKMVERIVRNLLSNAIRYTQSGGILLACRRKANGFIIQVIDTGIGISEDKIDSVFEKFVQVSENQQLTGQGYGLGLSIVKKLCNVLGHEMNITSTLDKGTAFTLVIENKEEHKSKVKPKTFGRRKSDHEQEIQNEIEKRERNKNLVCYSDDKNKDQSTEQVTSNSDINSAKLNSTRLNSTQLNNTSYSNFKDETAILIIDDDPVILDAIVSQIKFWGLNVIGVNTYEEAKVAIDDNHFNLIISDFQLGEKENGDPIEGVTVLRDIEQYLINDNKSVIPSFIITASLDEKILNIIKDSKYEFMRKPIKPAKLRAKIEFLLK